MAGNEGLFQAFKQFNDGLKSLSTTIALNSANQQVRQIRESQLEEAQKQEQLRSVAEDLTFKLTSLGASPQSIKQISDQFQPPELSQTELVRFRANEQLRVAKELLEEKQKATLEKKLIDEPKEKAQLVVKEIDKFDKRPDVKKLREQGDSIDAISNLLNEATKDKTAANAAFELTKIGLVKLAGESGRLSDQDLERAGANPSAVRTAARAIKRFAVGRATDDDVRDFKNMVNSMKAVVAASTLKKAKAFAQQRGRALPDIDQKEFESLLLETLPQPLDNSSLINIQPQASGEIPQLNLKIEDIQQFMTPVGGRNGRGF